MVTSKSWPPGLDFSALADFGKLSLEWKKACSISDIFISQSRNCHPTQRLSHTQCSKMKSGIFLVAGARHYIFITVLYFRRRWMWLKNVDYVNWHAHSCNCRLCIDCRTSKLTQKTLDYYTLSDLNEKCLKRIKLPRIMITLQAVSKINSLFILLLLQHFDHLISHFCSSEEDLRVNSNEIFGPREANTFQGIDSSIFQITLQYCTSSKISMKYQLIWVRIDDPNLLATSVT